MSIQSHTGLADDDRPLIDCSDVLRYARDPQYRAVMDAERDAMRATINAQWAARTRRENEARWAAEEAA